jgi:hypothetical protein
MILTDRDKEVFSFLEQFTTATTTQISKVVFGGNDYVCRRRLSALIKDSKVIKTDTGRLQLKRFRSSILAQYFYYIHKRPDSVEHYKMIADFYIALLGIPGTIESFEVQKKIGDCVPDGTIAFSQTTGDIDRITGKAKVKITRLFLECHRSNNPLNQEKYQKLYDSGVWRQYGWGVFPRIVYMTGKKVTLKNTRLLTYVVDETLSNIREIFK